MEEAKKVKMKSDRNRDEEQTDRHHTTGKFKSGILRVSRPVFLKIFTVVLLLWKVARLLTLSLQQRCQQ